MIDKLIVGNFYYYRRQSDETIITVRCRLAGPAHIAWTCLAGDEYGYSFSDPERREFAEGTGPEWLAGVYERFTPHEPSEAVFAAFVAKALERL